MLEEFRSVYEFVQTRKPIDPYFCVHSRVLEDAAQSVCMKFPGTVAYAFKCNPHPTVLTALLRGGIQAWDVASIDEVRAAKVAAPALPLYFMNPIKAPEHISEAYYEHGVREFAVDDFSEIARISSACGDAKDLTLIVRLSVPGGSALADLSGKFGAAPEQAIQLLRHIDVLGLTSGLTFHVGSQCLEPSSYSASIAMTVDVACTAATPISVLDIGGGFPAAYEGGEPAFSNYVCVISESLRGSPLEKCALRCEPGRSLAAAGVSVIARVEAIREKRNFIHINDGIYGSLSEIKFLSCEFPVRVLRADGKEANGPPKAWSIAGPTCDSTDVLSGPFLLPNDVCPGDYLEFGMMGAYSPALATRFNGFGARDWVEISGRPSWPKTSHSTRGEVFVGK